MFKEPEKLRLDIELTEDSESSKPIEKASQPDAAKSKTDSGAEGHTPHRSASASGSSQQASSPQPTPNRNKRAQYAGATCEICGKPIAGDTPRTNVTRYLAQESRCQCLIAEVAQPEEDSAKGTANRRSVSTVDAAQIKAMQQNLPERYQMLSLIGTGGMGTVFKVRDKELGKNFAVKMLKPSLIDTESTRQRFEREAVAARGLSHPNIVSIYDHGIGQSGAPYLVMDYIEGMTLEQLIMKDSFLSVPRAIDLFVQISEAVAHAHSKGVLHRDIKPSNILVQRSEQGVELAKLVDFGIAKTIGDETGLTKTEDILGSPKYMSPEQCEGNRLDARSDAYSFGCVMYEALCGRPPFEGKNSVKIILKHIRENAEPLSTACRDQKIPADLAYIVERCLAKNPVKRYQTVEELKVDLEKLRDGTPLTRVPSACPVVAPEIQTHRIKAASETKQSATPQNNPPKYELFKPSGVVVAALINPFAGYIVMAINYHRMGNQAAAALVVLAAIVVGGICTAFFAALHIENLSSGGHLIIYLISGAIMWQLTDALQGTALNEHKSRGGHLSSNWAAASIGLLGLVCSIALIFLIANLSHYPRH